jgi:hypothetical protein
MSSSLQTLIALGVVLTAAGLLVRGMLKKRGHSGCGNEGCGAVSQDVKALKKKLGRG